ncbi:MAG: SAM-dependent methyltransferase [Parabacteroides sp.]|nr:SAM-dependent methyltransferase [Parabacteroides sp.]
MQLLPENRIVRKLYRKMRYRKGFDVHSPFVFNLITKVIEERHSYYRFDTIESERRKLLYCPDRVEYPDRRRKNRLRTCTVAELVQCEAITRKKGMLLFRLVTYFGSRNIVQVGTEAGISTLYLTSYAAGLACVALEASPRLAGIAGKLLNKQGRNPVDIRTGDYAALLPAALGGLPQVDFVFFNTAHEGLRNSLFFREAVTYVHPGTVFVFDGISNGKEMKAFWKEVRANPAVTVSIDLDSMGLAFFDPKLYKRNYIVYF